jgi:hypothetical protein
MNCPICGSELEYRGKEPSGIDLWFCEKCSRYITGSLSPDAPIAVNGKGGMQSHLPYAFHLLDANAMMEIAKVFGQGAKKYARDNWRKISCEEHLNHAITHIFAALAGDKQDDHLSHAGARIVMALATRDDGSLEARPECTQNRNVS